MRFIPSVSTRAALACAVLLGSVSCTKPAKVEATSEAPTVAVAKAVARDLSRTLILAAEFKPFQEIDVMAKVAGYVKNINVDAGDRVKQGQLLAALERRVHLPACLLQACAVQLRGPGIRLQQIIADVGSGKIKVRSDLFERAIVVHEIVPDAVVARLDLPQNGDRIESRECHENQQPSESGQQRRASGEFPHSSCCNKRASN